MTQASIAAAPEKVWPVMSDVERWQEWTESIRSVEPLGDARAAVGARYRVSQPRLAPAVWTVTSWEPQRGFAWESRSPGLRAVGEHLIATEGAGCRVSLRVRFEGFLSPLIALLFGGLTRRYMALEAEGLKRRCEGGR